MVNISRPKSFSRTLALLPPAVGLVAQSASADFTAYIKFDDLNGEATSKTHANWSALPNFSFGFSNPTTISTGGGGLEAGKFVAEKFSFTKALDRISPELFLKCATGTAFESVKIELFDTLSGNVFYRITLNDVMISKITTSAVTDAGNVPTETVSVDYAKIKIEYSYQDSKGGVTPAQPVSWNLVENTP